MKIAIIGTGAMGSVYAGLLADANNEVWAIDAWQEHVDTINQKGLHLEGASGDRVVKLPASTNAADAGPCDLVIIATKAAHVEGAAESARPLLKDDTKILTIQNGLGSAARVKQVLGDVDLAVGVVGGFGASMKGPGHAHHNGMELVRLGEMAGPVTPSLSRVAQTWQDAGFNVRTFDDINKMIWEKLICNVCFSGPCAITERTVGEVMDDENAWFVASSCATEAWQVARAHDIAVDIDDPVDYVRNFGSKIPGSRPSLLLDHLNGRASEIDVINGAIPREAKPVNIATPFNDTIVALIKAKEAKLGLT